MRTLSQSGVCCERCPGATAENTRHITRRRLLKAAVFQPQAPPAYPGIPAGAGRQPGSPPGSDPTPSAAGPATADPLASAAAAGPILGGPLIDDSRSADLYRTVSGQIIDVSPHVITIGDSAGERRFTLTAAARAWRGAATEPAALHPGDDVVIRLLRSRPSVADRIWANLGRVTGTITEQRRDYLVVTEGATRRQQVVVIPPYASRRVEVRFPTLRPGYLLDLIGIRRADYLEAIIPATSQPTYRADMPPAAQRYTGRLSDTVSGSAVWHDSADEPYGVLGVLYPAVDPATGCAEDASAGCRPGEAPAVRDLPYLAVGSMLNVRNECAGISWTLPVTGCAPVARLFNDRCVTCQPSPRGRIADLTMASFIALGGEPETGCFSATLAIGR
ncbi:MAG: hypothetical protein M0030_22840 [Actinomycetota bacterium]|nr:hypothetical protein [Actinomycetota bacterium]